METTINQINLISDNGKCFNAYSYDRSISADGNTIVIGDDSDCCYRGSAYIFTRTGTEWIQQAKLVASDAATGDCFGLSVSISADGNTVVVAATFDNHAGGMNAGSAYIFTRSESSWVQKAKLKH